MKRIRIRYFTLLINVRANFVSNHTDLLILMINDDETRMFTTRDSSNLDGWIRKYVSSLAKVNTTF